MSNPILGRILRHNKVFSLSIEDLADLSEGTYTVKQILAYELHMFNVLDFDLSHQRSSRISYFQSRTQLYPPKGKN